jgi:predicted AAA+ superfamily ATPase
MKKYKEADVKIKRREVALETSNIYAIHGLRQFYELKKFGSRYDFRGLAEEIEEPVSHPTVIDYVRLMEDNFLLYIKYNFYL